MRLRAGQIGDSDLYHLFGKEMRHGAFAEHIEDYPSLGAYCDVYRAFRADETAEACVRAHTILFDGQATIDDAALITLLDIDIGGVLKYLPGGQVWLKCVVQERS